MRRSLERGFTLVEIMIVVAIIALLAGIAIPNVLRGRTTANESAAIGNLRAVISSLEMARSVNNAYPQPDGAAFVTTMYGAGGVPAGCAAAVVPIPDFGPPSFCRVLDGTDPGSVVQGYKYTYVAPAAGTTYTLNATPQTLNNTGTRSFMASETGLIRHCTTTVQDRQATVASPTIDAAIAACP